MSETRPYRETQLPIIDRPTITLYRDQVMRFRETLNQTLTFIALATGIPEREQSLFSLTAWLANNVSPEAAAKFDALGYAILSGALTTDRGTYQEGQS